MSPHPSPPASRTPTPIPSPPPQTRPAVEALKALLDQTLRIHCSDERVFIGTFVCVDKQLNIVLSNTDEYSPAKPEGRYVTMVMVPWRLIVRVFVHDSGLPVPGETTKYDDTPTISLSAPLIGGCLVRLLSVSLDPYMRNRMRPADVEGDMPAFELGGTITGFGVGVVLRSESALVKEGEHVYGFMPYQHYTIFPSMDSRVEGLAALGLTVITNEYNLPWRYFVGALGMTGQTAYYGLKDISSPKAGETLFISAAGGAVGTILIQLAKGLGLKVIASTGSDSKVALARELGADHAFNWRTSSYHDELRAHGPINIYFDHVGGESLEAAIDNAAPHARFIICGAVSTYNSDISEAYGVRNLWLLNRHRIRMEGFVVIDWHDRYLAEFYRTMPAKFAKGEIRYVEQVYKGLEEAGRGIRELLEGKTVGKSVCVIAEE